MTPKQARDIMCGWKRSGKELTPEQKRAGLLYDLHEEVAIWWHIYEYGSSDPFWPDGCNLNLTRTHIMNDVDELKKLGEDHSEVIPPEVPETLMIPRSKYFDTRYNRFKNQQGQHVVVADEQEKLF